MKFEGTVDWNTSKKKKVLTLKNPIYFAHHIKKFSGPVWVTITTQKRVRSPQANRRYWGAVIDHALGEAAEYTGYTKEELHEIFKRKFLQPKILIDPITKEQYPYYSTKNLDGREFMTYCMDVEDDLAKLGIRCPTPEEFHNGI